MEKILFIAILAIISNAPAYAAAGGHGGGAAGAGHGGGSHGGGVGNGAGGRQMNVIPSGAISNNGAMSDRRRKVQAGGSAEDDSVAASRLKWAQLQGLEHH
ncbi:MAG: hypothetical protein WCA63_07800 [Gallionella sp.]